MKLLSENDFVLLERDARRYRWLREFWSRSWFEWDASMPRRCERVVVRPPNPLLEHDCASLDGAIDEAMRS